MHLDENSRGRTGCPICAMPLMRLVAKFIRIRTFRCRDQSLTTSATSNKLRLWKFKILYGVEFRGSIAGLLISASACAAQEMETTEAGATSAGQGLLEIVFAGGWVGFSIVLVLFALSLTAAFLVFEQIMLLRRTNLVPSELSAHVRELVAKRQIDEATATCRQHPSLLSAVVLSGLGEAGDDWASIEKAMEDSLAEQSAGLMRRVEYLSVIGNLAPMVGLLGTVTGMIFAFQQVATTQGSAGAAELAEGIYQALVTTVGGLIVAIPSLAAFAIFRNRIDQMVAEAAYAAHHCLKPLKGRARPPSLVSKEEREA